MAELSVRLLGAETWPAYEALIQKHNGVWEGCWCMGFHRSTQPAYDSVEQRRAHKKELVRCGEARAALVFEDETAVGWCQFGRFSELTAARKFKRHYQSGLTHEPDWVITCFFVDRHKRGRGVASRALDGALEVIAREGGGLVEAYPEDIEGRSGKGQFTPLGTLPMFARRGFEKQRPVSMHHWVMTKTVLPRT